MQVEHHDLHHEFPEMVDAIHALKVGNAHLPSCLLHITA